MFFKEKKNYYNSVNLHKIFKLIQMITLLKRNI